jgi:glutamine amidotransferase
MIAIIDYKAGNLASVANAFRRLDTDFIITNKIADLEQSDGIIFPGVGHAYAAMSAVNEVQLDGWLKQTKKPLLGICLGMQLLFEGSEEGDTKTLGIIPGYLKKFDSAKGKVPHMGWNTFNTFKDDHPLLKGLSKDSYFYYVHSYYAPVNEATIATCDYINPFASVVVKDNFFGVQFHPEKSGESGEILLKNFLSLVHASGVKV